jgi:hypothetical protein
MGGGGNFLDCRGSFSLLFIEMFRFLFDLGPFRDFRYSLHRLIIVGFRRLLFSFFKGMMTLE